MLVWLDRQITATKLIFHYRIDAVAPPAGGTYMAAICDASGRLIFNANSQAVGNTINTRYHDVMTMPSTVLDPGYYWYVFGLSVSTNTNVWGFLGGTSDITNTNLGSINRQVNMPNIYLTSTVGGATFPPARNILGMADAVGSSVDAVPVPMFSLAR
jgi:hypothetical protein